MAKLPSDGVHREHAGIVQTSAGNWCDESPAEPSEAHQGAAVGRGVEHYSGHGTADGRQATIVDSQGQHNARLSESAERIAVFAGLRQEVNLNSTTNTTLSSAHAGDLGQ